MLRTCLRIGRATDNTKIRYARYSVALPHALVPYVEIETLLSSRVIRLHIVDERLRGLRFCRCGRRIDVVLADLSTSATGLRYV